MKIGLVLPAFVTGGAERVVLDLAAGFQDDGHSVEVISALRGGDFLETFKVHGLRIAEFDLHRSFQPLPSWWKKVVEARRVFERHFKTARFDVVHTHLMGPDIDALVAAQRVKVPVIVHSVHNVYPQYSARTVMGRIRNSHRRHAWRGYDRLYAVDEEVRKWIVECRMAAGEKVGVIANGIELPRFAPPANRALIRERLGWGDDERVLLNVGSLTEQKNQASLVEAISLLTGSTLRTRLAIAGVGPLETQLGRTVRSCGLDSQVDLLGARNDVPELLSAADVFVFPSLWEGLPIALLEAMASGIPIIASDIPVHRRILGGGRLGVLTSPDPEPLASALRGVFLDPEGSTRRAHEASSQVREEYDRGRMAKEYLFEYRRLLSEKTNSVSD
ncbi:glycosyltransferase family 4 protein [Gemmatimonadota bacterium]